MQAACKESKRAYKGTLFLCGNFMRLIKWVMCWLLNGECGLAVMLTTAQVAAALAC